MNSYSDTGFYSAQTSYLYMKVLTYENMQFFLTTANLSYGQKVDTSVTTPNFILTSLQLYSIV